MNPRLKAQLIAAACAVFALTAGWWIAQEQYAFPLLAATIGAGACAYFLTRLSLDVFIIGSLIIGYIVGNRGFAQFSLVPGLPLLPAEVGLAVGGAWLAVRAALARQLPLRRDALNITIALWLIVGAARLMPDVRAHGALALRDFAMIYYAGFFFLAQACAREVRAAVFLERCMLGAMVILIPLFECFRRFPEFFLNFLTIRGTPIIFLKGDLVATFIAGGVVLAYARFEESRSWFWWIASACGIASVLSGDNRASMVALACATGGLALARRWGLLRMHAGLAGAGALVLLFGVVIGVVSPRDNAAYKLYERIVSITDVSGTRDYDDTSIEFKGDNNRFRLVWWRAVYDETIVSAPVIGLGFGHDLAAGFVRRYYAASEDEFTTRSPHNIWMTTFGRMGAIGVALLFAIVVAMASATRRALQASSANPTTSALWLVAWVVFVSACFGVVLEGPMGAVVFWTALGMANATATPLQPGRAADPEHTTGLAEFTSHAAHKDAVATVPLLPTRAPANPLRAPPTP